MIKFYKYLNILLFGVSFQFRVNGEDGAFDYGYIGL